MTKQHMEEECITLLETVGWLCVRMKCVCFQEKKRNLRQLALKTSAVVPRLDAIVRAFFKFHLLNSSCEKSLHSSHKPVRIFSQTIAVSSGHVMRWERTKVGFDDYSLALRMGCMGFFFSSNGLLIKQRVVGISALVGVRIYRGKHAGPTICLLFGFNIALQAYFINQWKINISATCWMVK